MLLKISLGLAILLGLATLFLTHTQVSGKIKQLDEDLTSTRTTLTQTQASESKLRAETKTLRAQVEETTTALGEATNLLAQAQAKAEEQQIRADRASTDLTTVTAERNRAQEELSQWRLFEMTPEQIRNHLARLRQVERERDVYVTENQTLTRKNSNLQRELDRYTGGMEKEIPVPPGTRGNIVAVDPKYDFVILDIGGNQELVPGAKLLVNRDGKLIGQVKVTSVEPNRAIANVLPEWKQDELMEGDQVIAKFGQ
jgi:regulator of replication initiation timing